MEMPKCLKWKAIKTIKKCPNDVTLDDRKYKTT